jgi:hypothetical protein
MVVRRSIYQTPWYKKFEKTFIGALNVRFEMIGWGEVVPEAEGFVNAILPRKLQRKHTATIVEIVNVIDRRANESHSGNA